MPIVRLRRTHKVTGSEPYVTSFIDTSLNIKAEGKEEDSKPYPSWRIKASQMELAGAVGYLPYVKKDGCVSVNDAFVEEQ